MPSFADTWGWVMVCMQMFNSDFNWYRSRWEKRGLKKILFFMYIIQASDQPFSINADEIDRRIEERVNGELLYLNGASFLSSATMNKAVYLS